MSRTSNSRKMSGFQKLSYLLNKEAREYWHLYVSCDIDLSNILEETKDQARTSSIFLKAIGHTLRKNLEEFPQLNAELLTFPYKRVRYFNFIGANIPFLREVNGELIFSAGIINDIDRKSLKELDLEIEQKKKGHAKEQLFIYKMPICIMKLLFFISKYFDKYRKKYRGTFVFIKVPEEFSEVYTSPNATLQFVLHEAREGKTCKLSITADHRLLHIGIIKKFISDLKEVLEKEPVALLK